MGAWATLPFFTLLSTIGLVFGALALLLMFQRIFLGPLKPMGRGLRDITMAELWTALPLLALLLVLGIYPAFVINLTNTAANAMVSVFMRVLS